MSKYKNVLIICTGNICRSPMAVGLLRKELMGHPEIRIISAGIIAGDGNTASSNAVEAMKEIGISIAGHRSRHLTKEVLKSSDIVIVMTQAHKLEVVHMLDAPGKEIYLIKEFSSNEHEKNMNVSDPIGESILVYTKCRDEIKLCVKNLAKKILED